MEGFKNVYKNYNVFSTIDRKVNDLAKFNYKGPTWK